MEQEVQHGDPGQFAGPRIARAVIVTVLFGYVLNTLLAVVSGGLRGTQLLAFVACLSATFLLQLAHSTGDPLRWPRWLRASALSTQAGVTFLPFLWVGPQAGALAGFVAGSVLLVVEGRWRWWLYLLIAGGVWLGMWREGLAVVDSGYGFYFTLLTGLMVYGVSSLGSLVSMVYAARGELARMAVVRERLRVARDLHDLLGFSISAMTLKSELAYRLLPAAADRARRELQDVLAAAHRALADIRMITGNDRRMSTAAEIELARTIFTATEMEVRLDVSLPELPEEIDTALAIVLREAATNVLRHSKAQHCVIEAGVRDGQVRLLVGNDGVESGAGVPIRGGAGLGNLADRLASVGGRLAVTAEAGWFRLTATVPVPEHAPASKPARPARPGADPERASASAAENAGQPWHRRVARTLTISVLTGYGILVIINAIGRSPVGPGLLGFVGCVGVLVGVQLTHALGEPRLWPARVRAATLSAQAAATVLPLAWIGAPWGSMGGFLAGSLLLLLAGAVRWVAFGAVGAGVLALALLHRQPADLVAYLTLSTLLTGLVVYVISSLSGMVRQVYAARLDLTRMAVVQERLRVSRDLQDRLGQHLSAMRNRSERAFRILPADPGQARAEVADVLDVARRALAEVRTVASGYRHMSFPVEVDSAMSTLTAAGIEVEVDVPAEAAVPQEVDALSALVLREAVTNVIRHSEARSCTIQLSTDHRAVRLRVANDGVRSPALPAQSAPPTGSGLGDLAERLRAIGGTLTVATAGGTVQLMAEIPAGPKSDDGPATP